MATVFSFYPLTKKKRGTRQLWLNAKNGFEWQTYGLKRVWRRVNVFIETGNDPPPLPPYFRSTRRRHALNISRNFIFSRFFCSKIRKNSFNVFIETVLVLRVFTIWQLLKPVVKNREVRDCFGLRILLRVEIKMPWLFFFCLFGTLKTKMTALLLLLWYTNYDSTVYAAWNCGRYVSKNVISTYCRVA